MKFNEINCFINLIVMVFGRVIVHGISLGFRPIKSYLYKHFFARRFAFHSVKPINKTKFETLPHHQWPICILLLTQKGKESLPKDLLIIFACLSSVLDLLI